MSRRSTRMETFEQRVTREALEAHRRSERARSLEARRRNRLVYEPTTYQPTPSAGEGEPKGYPCPELRPFDGRPGAMQAFDLPSRMNNRLHYRDGRVTDLQGKPLES
ncbi:hypothetical protein QRO08_16780 [Paracidovorax citrulli]|uniref:Uncharacterized protein n=3 Tax=Paracidovorax citrulli TaxID=80869 RepID=A1TMK1_PARC0|nr:hypothetical protein [Paracidovorax citrulli]ABM32189.1 hypothetical protein Aave_1602 [Paracidovorax citrulli AAC00-1]ATG94797.1 hypothetical protein CQB05_12770 [Paracidovorax citrulli]MVT38480.1 hypothetical protein [Paracidovorax citrulli]PVY66379.1 hypothetical protein C8E08_3786 [Paracidovorax citrulli]REG69450.1 hypothetical protein C8E07_2601 [Paracidovorax citrulli]